MPAYVVSILLLVITLFVGAGSGTAAGVRSFLEIGPIRFQPSELAKLATILALARYLGTRPEDPATLRALVNPSAIVGLPLVLVILQPDLGTALAFVGILFAALFWAGTPVGLLALLLSPGISLVLSSDYRIWAASFVFLVGALYLYRYRLFLVESLSVILVNLAAGTISTPLWNSLAGYQQNRILVFWTRASIPGSGLPRCAVDGGHRQWRTDWKGVYGGDTKTLRLSTRAAHRLYFFPLSERSWGTWEPSSLCRYSRSSSIGS